MRKAELCVSERSLRKRRMDADEKRLAMVAHSKHSFENNCVTKCNLVTREWEAEGTV